MKHKTIIALLLVLPCIASLAVRSVGQSEKFSALGFLPTGAGMRGVGAGSTFNVDVYINGYTSDDEARQLAGVLLEGGNDVLHKRLEDMKSLGRITPTGRVGFYDLKLIRSHKLPAGGRRIIAVTDRPIQFLEQYVGGRSTDYNFGLLQIDLKPNKKGREQGEGSLLYAAKVKVIGGKSVEVESYGISPVALRNVRKL
jgi:hypothetical protein